MISLHHEDPFHRFPGTRVPAPDTETLQQSLALAASKHYNQTKAIVWKHAMTLANGGVMPSDDEVRQRAQEVVTTDGRVYLLWDHPPLAPGDTPDMSFCIAEIEQTKP